ncbi:MAG: SDR family oxidoreductase [Saprospiraceae bacterium]|nr:SDR family oxidoreductase [Saprospiraceae bacterium]
MQDKIILITGGNDGIGKATAIGLARMGARVVIACRNMEKATKALVDIKKESNNDQVEVLHLDLASFDSIKNCVENFNTRYNKLDVLINNAAHYTSYLQKTEEGFEMQFGVNHLGHFLLTYLLLPSLQAAERPRIVNVASNGHYGGKIDFNNLRGEKFVKKYYGFEAYAQSKLANVLFTKEFSRRYPDMICNCLHPGGVSTNIATKNANTLATAIWNLAKPFLMSPEQGAQTSIYLASSPKVNEINGQFFDEKQKIRKPSRLARNNELAKKLWDISMKFIYH